VNTWVPHCSLVSRTVLWVSLLIVGLCRRLRAPSVVTWKRERRTRRFERVDQKGVSPAVSGGFAMDPERSSTPY
jgi:hypothetical protein